MPTAETVPLPAASPGQPPSESVISTCSMLPARTARQLAHSSRQRAAQALAGASRVPLPPLAAALHSSTPAPTRPTRPQRTPQPGWKRTASSPNANKVGTKPRHFHSTPPSGPAQAYDHQVATGLISNDDHQRSIVAILQRMHDELDHYQPPPIGPLPPPVKPSAWTRLMRSRLFADMSDELHQANTAVIPLPPPPPGLPNGLYLYGSVGCGKSFLMDLFYANLPEKYREPGAEGNSTSFGSKRVHFHQFMMEVHKKGHKIKMEQGGGQDWIVIAAREIAEETRVLCFDEFQVSAGGSIGSCCQESQNLHGQFFVRSGRTTCSPSLSCAGHGHRRRNDLAPTNGGAARPRGRLRHDIKVSSRSRQSPRPSTAQQHCSSRLQHS